MTSRTGPKQPPGRGQQAREWNHRPVLMDLYIHPLYVLVRKILSSILNSPALIHPLYHPLSPMRPLVTLSKYIHSIHYAIEI
jgi:hypothetical protein